jgi:hypothetical protein
MVTELEIIDTAVKIGLGSLITGVTSYFLFDQKHKADTKKEYHNEKRALIKELSIKLEEVESHLNEMVVNIENGQKEAALKAMIPAGKEIYLVRALSNMIGNESMCKVIDNLAKVVEETFGELTATPINLDNIEDLITNQVPALKAAAYPYIRELYENCSA